MGKLLAIGGTGFIIGAAIVLLFNGGFTAAWQGGLIVAIIMMALAIWNS